MSTEFGGNIYYREAKSTTDLRNISVLVNKRYPDANFTAISGFIMTLDNPMQYGVRSSRNLLQQILAWDGTHIFAILLVFRADSAYLSSSGYVDFSCSKKEKFYAYTEHDFENYLDEINPVVVKLIDSKCNIPTGKYFLW